MTNFQADTQILKVDDDRGLIFGFAVVCKVAGEDFYDLDNEHITEDAMFDAANDFAASERVSCKMHERDASGAPVKDGGVLHTFPLTTEIAKALGIQTEKTGLLVALKPDNQETLDKARSGEYTGFSIGGSIIEVEDE